MRLGCMLLVLAGAGAASAGEPPVEEQTRLAREHFTHGRELYVRGQFDDASTEFELGYRGQQLPLFLYNIAQCARRAGRIDKAIDFYQRYLAANRDAPERAEVRRYLEELEQQRPALVPPRLVAPVAVAAPSEQIERKRSRRGLWIALGVGAAVIVVAGVATGLALGLPRDAPATELGNHRLFLGP